jgi:hypothetical protein
MEELWFLRGPCRDVISKGQSQDRELCTGVCEERLERVKLKNLHC